MTADSRAGNAGRVLAGTIPPLADAFSARPEMASALADVLPPGGSVVLVPSQPPTEKPEQWLEPCGKTQLAVSFAEWLWQTRKIDVLLWVTATSQAAVLGTYAEAAVAALGADLAATTETIAGRFVNWLGHTGQSWLVVLDDLADGVDLSQLRPRGPGGRLLITTRDQAVADREHRALALPVGVFSPRDALNYMTGRLTADTDQRLGAIDLVQELGYEPVALVQASAVIASSALSCRDYQEYFARRWEEMAGAADGRPAAAAVTWSFSMEQADRLSPGGGARALLALLALLDGNGIPAAVLLSAAVGAYLAPPGEPPAADSAVARAALLVLERVGLVSVSPPAAPMVRMNAAVQAAVRAATPGAELARAARAAAGALLEAWPAHESGPWTAEPYRSSAMYLQHTAGDLLLLEGCHPLLVRAGDSLAAGHLTGPAAGYWREITAACETLLGPEHPDTLAAGYRLAQASLTAGRTSEAVSWFHWALTSQARALGPDHPVTLTAQVDLGRALVADDRLSEAVAVLGRAVSDYDRVYGHSDLATLAAREELAAAECAGGLLGDAIQLYRQTLDDRGHLQGPQHPDTIATRRKLAATYLADHQVKDALSQYKRVLADAGKALGPDHLDTIGAAEALAGAQYAAGRMASALQSYEQAAQGYDRVLGADHPRTLACRASLANAYYAVGRLTDGLTMLRDTVARAERVLPRGDPLLRSIRESLSSLAGE